MQQGPSLSETLQRLSSKGYQLADPISTHPDESIRSNDWRLDAVHQVIQEKDLQSKALVVAVSSSSRNLKLIFVEEMAIKSDFSPMNLLRKLFPMRHKG